MTPTLILLALAALGVGIVVWATRRKSSRPYQQRQEQDTAWNDPVAPNTTSPDTTGVAPADPFANAPSSGDTPRQP
jgi:hypothetical protein